MLTDLWAHRYADDPKEAENTFEDDDFDPDTVAAQIGYHAPEPEPVQLPDDFEDFT